MLNPGQIPQQEPIISVGIVLPEDDTQSLQLKLPDNIQYQLKWDEKAAILATGTRLSVQLLDDGLTTTINNNSENITVKKVIEISPEKIDFDRIAPQSGILLKNVITGRNFHWKKRIDIHLPGSIIIKRIDNTLLLINRVPLESYLMCVATSEMGAVSPPALIEAQTIAARSWLLCAAERKHNELGIDACNDDCCQRYQGTTHLSKQSIAGAQNTKGMVLLYEGKICDARYSKSCGGMTEAYQNIWQGEPIPYLSALPDIPNVKNITPLNNEKAFRKWITNPPTAFCSPQIIPEKNLKQYLGSVDETGHYYRWRIELKQQDLVKNINLHFKLNVAIITDLIPLKRGASGRITKLKLQYKNKKNKDKE